MSQLSRRGPNGTSPSPTSKSERSSLSLTRICARREELIRWALWRRSSQGMTGPFVWLTCGPPLRHIGDLWSSWGRWACLWKLTTTRIEFLPKLRGIMLWEWGKLGQEDLLELWRQRREGIRGQPKLSKHAVQAGLVQQQQKRRPTRLKSVAFLHRHHHHRH